MPKITILIKFFLLCSELSEAAGGLDEGDSEEGEVDVDMNAMVQRLEAKCQNVREELGRMAVSEQYMRTKQAQLVSKIYFLNVKSPAILGFPN